MKDGPHRTTDREGGCAAQSARSGNEQSSARHECHPNVLHKVMIERSRLHDPWNARIPGVRVNEHPGAIDQMAEPNKHKKDPEQHRLSRS